MKMFGRALLSMGLAVVASVHGSNADDCQITIPPLGIRCPTDAQGQSLTYADPDHCSKYWECYNGCATEFICQFDYLYDDVHKWCNFADQVSCGNRDCDGRPCKANPTTLHPYDFICPEANGYFADPANCMKYYVCQEWYPTRKSCATASNGEQELYDPVNNWCNFAEYVDCGDRPVCKPDDTDCGIVTTPTPNQCQQLECNSDGWFAEGPCEQCVCECSSGNGYEICCGSGLVWNSISNSCDFTYNVPGCT